MRSFYLTLKTFLCFPSPTTTDNWNKFSHPYTKKEFGKWELILPPKYDKTAAVDHNTKLKVENKKRLHTCFFFFTALGKV